MLVIMITWNWYILGISYTNIYDDWIHFYMFLSICYILTLLKPKLFSWYVFLTGNHCIWEFCEIQEFILVTLCDSIHVYFCHDIWFIDVMSVSYTIFNDVPNWIPQGEICFQTLLFSNLSLFNFIFIHVFKIAGLS